jgi:hypothetical protein
MRYAVDGGRMAGEDGDLRRYGSALNNIGLIHRIQGHLADAVPPLTQALGIWREIKDQRGEAAALGNLAITARQAGDVVRSRQFGMASLDLYLAVDIPEGVMDVLDAVACLDILAGSAESGLRLLTVSERERAKLGAPILIEDEIRDRTAAVAAAHRTLGARAAEVVAAARNVSLDTVLAELRGRG